MRLLKTHNIYFSLSFEKNNKSLRSPFNVWRWHERYHIHMPHCQWHYMKMIVWSGEFVWESKLHSSRLYVTPAPSENHHKHADWHRRTHPKTLCSDLCIFSLRFLPQSRERSGLLCVRLNSAFLSFFSKFFNSMRCLHRKSISIQFDSIASPSRNSSTRIGLLRAECGLPEIPVQEFLFHPFDARNDFCAEKRTPL